MHLLPPDLLLQPPGRFGAGVAAERQVASADEWRSVLEPVVARQRDLDIRKYFRGDAAFAIPELYVFLEKVW